MVREGVLLMNIGTPDEPTIESVREYLREFLLDPDVIDIPAPLRHLLVRGIILRTRPRKIAPNYQSIWMKEGSPLRVYTQRMTDALEQMLDGIPCEVGMRYGNPSIKQKMYKLQEQGCEKLIVIPLYPQYAAATTATVCDEVYRTLMKMRWQPSLQIIPHYESEPLYITALVNSIEKKISEIKWTPDLIVASYHGIPKKYFDKGDPYQCYCQKTSRLIKESFNKIPLLTTFQSRFGPQEWLQPYTDKTFENLPKEGKKKLLVICPGFSSDCVETLEEISIQGKESFLDAGGEEFDVVPCLNDNEDHIKLLTHLIQKYHV